MFAVGFASLVLTSGCALGSNAPGRAAAAVKDGSRRETLGNDVSEAFAMRLYGAGPSLAEGAATSNARLTKPSGE